MDIYGDHASTLTAPVREAAAISGSTTLAQTTRAIYVGTGGDLRVTMAGGQVVTFPGVPGGALLPLRVTALEGGGTTAGGIVALW